MKLLTLIGLVVLAIVPGSVIIAVTICLVTPRYRAWALSRLSEILKKADEHIRLAQEAFKNC
jgi:hypothetical protein